MTDLVQTVYDASVQAVDALLNENRPHFNPVRLLVVGGSSSEIAGGVIGHNSTYELGEALANAVIDRAEALGFDCAFQCCEHLNRSLVVERATAELNRTPLETMLRDYAAPNAEAIPVSADKILERWGEYPEK